MYMPLASLASNGTSKEIEIPLVLIVAGAIFAIIGLVLFFKCVWPTETDGWLHDLYFAKGKQAELERRFASFTETERNRIREGLFEFLESKSGFDWLGSRTKRLLHTFRLLDAMQLDRCVSPQLRQELAEAAIGIQAGKSACELAAYVWSTIPSDVIEKLLQGKGEDIGPIVNHIRPNRMETLVEQCVLLGDATRLQQIWKESPQSVPKEKVERCARMVDEDEGKKVSCAIMMGDREQAMALRSQLTDIDERRRLADAILDMAESTVPS